MIVSLLLWNYTQSLAILPLPIPGDCSDIFILPAVVSSYLLSLSLSCRTFLYVWVRPIRD